MFCENEKSIHPKTHMCISQSNCPKTMSNGDQMKRANDLHANIFCTSISQADGVTDPFCSNPIALYTQHSEDGKQPIPLSKSVSLKTFSEKNSVPDSSKFVNSQNKFKYGGLYCSDIDNYNSPKMNNNTNTNIIQKHSRPLQTKGSFLARNQCDNNDSESSSGSDLIDLRAKKKVSVNEMYNDDIDYMNNYLKSLPDYNELNKKISNEQQKCEDIYGRLLCINSSLKSNMLPKSNSYHSISVISTKPYRTTSAQNGDKAKNNIIRSSSSSTVNHGMINSPDKFGVAPIKSQNPMQMRAYPNQKIVATHSQNIPQGLTKFTENKKIEQPLPKNVPISGLQHSDSKKGLNDFWSENIAKSNQQKLGWNYGRIMASRLENSNSNRSNSNMNNFRENEEIASPASGYRLQKNLSLNQLGQKIQQNVSREELYNLICNNDLESAQEKTQPNSITNEINNNQRYEHRLKSHKLQTPLISGSSMNPLSKSFSQSSMSSTQFLKVKSPKNRIPVIFKPLCKSNSLNKAYNQTEETFTPKYLMKSSSSSSIHNNYTRNINGNIKSMKNDNFGNENAIDSNFIQSKAQSKISKNNDLLRAQKQNPFLNKSSLGIPVFPQLNTLKDSYSNLRPNAQASQPLMNLHTSFSSVAESPHDPSKFSKNNR